MRTEAPPEDSSLDRLFKRRARRQNDLFRMWLRSHGDFDPDEGKVVISGGKITIRKLAREPDQDAHRRNQ